VARILNMPPVFIANQITYLQDSFTSQVETDIEAELVRWDGVSTDFVRVHPRERNYGAELNPEDEKRDIRQNIATMLQRPDWANNAGGGLVGTVARG
jgi:hypothetical protein